MGEPIRKSLAGDMCDEAKGAECRRPLQSRWNRYQVAASLSVHRVTPALLDRAGPGGALSCYAETTCANLRGQFGFDEALDTN